MELVKEETAEIPSRSADDSDDENGSVRYDILDMIYDISENNISGSESYSNFPTHLPKWAKKILSSTGRNIGNSTDPRRTRSDFQREGIALYFNYSLLSKTCYMMIGMIRSPTTMLGKIQDGKLQWMKSSTLSGKMQLGS